MNSLFLSYTLGNDTLGFKSKKNFKSKTVKCMQEGDSCNESWWEFSNHMGTHIDAPFHFSANGKTLDQYHADFWICDNIHLVNLNVQKGELIEPNEWCEDIPRDTDLLLLKTNFEKYRDTDPYYFENPGLSPQLGEWLRSERQLKMIGFDFISVTSYLHRDAGRVAHRSFLDPDLKGEPILAIEDMRLREVSNAPKQVIISPIRVEKSDGSPVTIIAKL